MTTETFHRTFLFDRTLEERCTVRRSPPQPRPENERPWNVRRTFSDEKWTSQLSFGFSKPLPAAPAERASGTDAAGSSRCAEPAPAVGQVSARALRPRKRPPLATTELRDCACRGVGAEPAAPALNTPQSRGVVVAGPRLSGMHGRGVGAVISCALGVCQGEVRDVQPDSRSVQRLWGTARRVNGAPRPYHERDMRGVAPAGCMS